VRAAVGSRYGDILPAEGHLLDLLEPEDVVPAWKRWSPILLRPEGLYGTRPAEGGNKAAKLKAIREALRTAKQGLIVNIRRSKTDQDGAGRKIGIPLGRTAHCPVMAVERWVALAGIASGPLFRPVDRHGRVSQGRLSGEAVSLIVRARVAAAGLDPTGYSGHSVRAGFATSAAMAGVQSWKIRQQTGHASDAMLTRYVRDGGLFVDNAVSALL